MCVCACVSTHALLYFENKVLEYIHNEVENIFLYTVYLNRCGKFLILCDLYFCTICKTFIVNIPYIHEWNMLLPYEYYR